jgi:ABC-type antimicrobial peptide transport system permease subunit
MTDRVSRMTARDRFTTVLLTVFASIALLLAAFGIYGVLAFRVADRMREIGIRMAVGATGHEVRRLVLHDGLGVTFIGLVLGLVAAAALSRLLESQLYSVSTLNPATFFSAGMVLLVAAGIACFLPSLRASRVDPMVTLRHE